MKAEKRRKDLEKPKKLHFSLVRGQAQELAPFLGVFDQGWPALYVLAEPIAGEEDCPRAVAAAGRSLSTWSLSITAGLRSAFQEVHKELAAAGRQIGLACVALKGERLYGAQAGPPLAYLYSLGQWRRLGPEGSLPALGSPAKPEPQFWSHIVREGDLLLLAQSPLARLASPEALSLILSTGASQVVQRLYHLARGEPRFACLLLSFSAGAP